MQIAKDFPVGENVSERMRKTEVQENDCNSMGCYYVSVF